MSHLTFEKRRIIEKMIAENKSIRQIGIKTNAHHTTILRDIKNIGCLQIKLWEFIF